MDLKIIALQYYQIKSKDMLQQYNCLERNYYLKSVLWVLLTKKLLQKW